MFSIELWQEKPSFLRWVKELAGTNYTWKDYQAYLQWQSLGTNMPDTVGAASLKLAHKLASGLQVELWLEGHFSGDFPLGLLLNGMIRDGTVTSATFLQALMLWEKLNPQIDSRRQEVKP